MNIGPVGCGSDDENDEYKFMINPLIHHFFQLNKDTFIRQGIML